MLSVDAGTPAVPGLAQAKELAAIFKSGGANVAISWHQCGRELGEDDVQAAKSWFARYGFGKGLAA
jgi:predicted esterase